VRSVQAQAGGVGWGRTATVPLRACGGGRLPACLPGAGRLQSWRQAISPSHVCCPPWRGGESGSWSQLAGTGAAMRRDCSRDKNGRKRMEKPYFYFRFYIFLAEMRSGFEKCGFENGIGICGHTETDKYRWRAEKLN
jgi:hypothetical protein